MTATFASFGISDISVLPRCITGHLLAEVKRHGPGVTAQNRFGRATLFETQGDHEEAERLAREGQLALALVGKGI